MFSIIYLMSPSSRYSNISSGGFEIFFWKKKEFERKIKKSILLCHSSYSDVYIVQISLTLFLNSFQNDLDRFSIKLAPHLQRYTVSIYCFTRNHVSYYKIQICQKLSNSSTKLILGVKNILFWSYKHDDEFLVQFRKSFKFLYSCKAF